MNKKTNVNEFLKKNNAIFSYLRDDNGNKIGVILATPGDAEKKAPMIGFAFFEEVSTEVNVDNCYKTLKTVKEIPAFANQLKNLGVKEEDINNLKLPGLSSGYFRIKQFRPEMINKLATIKLARQRANFFHTHFYVDLDDEYQASSCLYQPDGATAIFVRRRNVHPGWGSMETPYFSTKFVYATSDCIRKQIKAFEFRALKYYKYIKGYRG